MNKFNTRSKVLLASTVTAALLFSGCGSSDNFVFTNTNNPVVPTPPIAANDAFNALGNATVNQAASGVLANDTVNGATISAFDAVGSQGGAIDLQADGSFTYTPALNFKGAETFSYTLLNGFGESTATVTMTSTGLGRFVDNSAAPGGTGTQTSPFNTLQAGLDAADPGDTVYVSSGDGNNTGVPGGFTLPAGVQLIGEGTGLILAQTVEPAGTKPLINGPIICLGDNLIQGFTIDGSTDELIRIDSVGNVTVNENTLLNPTNEHIDCDDVTGTVTVSNNMLDNPPDDSGMDYMRVDNASTNATIAITGNTYRNTGQTSSNVDSLAEMDATGTSVLNITCSSNVANGTVADEFDYGFYFENSGTGLCTMAVNDNVLSNFDSYPIGFFAYDGPLTGTCSGNMVSNVSDRGIYLYAGGGTQTVSGNTVSNTTYGLDLEFDGPANGTFVVENNNVSNSSFSAIFFGENDENTDNKVALRNNTLTGSTSEDVDVEMDDTGTICLDITANTFNSDVRFDDTGAGSITVERFGNASGDELKTVNTFNVPATVVVSNDPVVDAIPGFCAIP
jgi:parallel beta-helix repeat protein